MLPATPNWLKFRRWRARKSAAAGEQAACVSCSADQPAAKCAESGQPAVAGQLQARQLVSSCDLAASRQVSSTTSSEAAAAAAATTTETTRTTEITPTTTPTGSGLESSGWRAEGERVSRPRRKLAHLIPRSFSNLIGRALSPASSINQNANMNANNNNNNNNNENENKEAPRVLPKQRAKLTSEDEMTTSNSGCCLQAPDLIAQADSQGGRPKSPLRKFRRHLACGQQGQRPQDEGEPASSELAQLSEPSASLQREEEEALETKTSHRREQQQLGHLPAERLDDEREAKNDASAGRRRCQEEGAEEEPPFGSPDAERSANGQARQLAANSGRAGSELARAPTSRERKWTSCAAGDAHAAKLIASNSSRQTANWGSSSSQKSERPNASAGCHLTAHTRDNQCALHGSSWAEFHSELASGEVGADCGAPIGGPTDCSKPKPQAAGSNSTSTSTSNAASHASGGARELEARTEARSWRRQRAARKTPRALAKSVPTWPLAKRTLDNNLASELRLGHFGDCEDLLSAHLAGRLFGALAADSVAPAQRVGPELEASLARTQATAAAATPPARAHHAPPGADQARTLDQVRALNYNHKRPFARPYETPPTGWLFNATGLPPINAHSSAALKAKLFASSAFRRRSYDDQEGDNDFNIILQPSDIDQLEREAKASCYAQSMALSASLAPPAQLGASSKWEARVLHESAPSASQAARAEVPKSGAFVRPLRRLPNGHDDSVLASALSSARSFEDIKLAKCLLDQDYKQTVRLFIERSALNWNFNSFTFDALSCGRSLTELLLHLFDFYNLFKLFQLDIVKVLKCFRLLEFGYHSTNPYHNSVHAADVTQAMHCFIQEHKIRKHMTHLEVLSSILGAVCHDLDHPGVNQSFLVATKNPLVSLYGNTSVLENHHWRFALCIFKESQLFDHFDSSTLEHLKEQLKHLILATDIARQNEYLKQFREMTSSRTFSMSNTTDRALVLQMALKCADLGNPCRPWMISRVWSNLICDEFYRMGQIERRLNLPLTPICQRHKTSIAGIQADFFRFIVLPLLELWHGFLSSPLSDLLMANFHHNYRRWQRASRIVQQLRRRKSVACLGPLEDAQHQADKQQPLQPLQQHHRLPHRDQDQSEKSHSSSSALEERISGELLEQQANLPLEHVYMDHSFRSVKRASSDYVKSGNGWLECMRDFQLNQTIEKSPQVRRAHKRQREAAVAAAVAASAAAAAAVATTTSTQSQEARTETVVSQDKPPPLAPAHKDASSRTVQPQQQQQQQQHLRDYSAHRKALSPIQDGEAASPDEAGASSMGLQEYGRESPLSTASSRGESSSACSSPVAKARPLTGRNLAIGGANAPNVTEAARRYPAQQAQKHCANHPYATHLYEPISPMAAKLARSAAAAGHLGKQSGSGQKAFYNNMRRRESDPGALTDELAAAIVLIQYQSNSLYHKRRSSLPICMPRRRSSK